MYQLSIQYNKENNACKTLISLQIDQNQKKFNICPNAKYVTNIVEFQ